MRGMMRGVMRPMMRDMMVGHVGRGRACMHGRGHDPIIEAFEAEQSFPLGPSIALVHGHDYSPLYESERASGRRQYR
jgi:hypothetical protein